MKSRLRLPAVYPITDRGLARAATHLSILKELSKGGATLVQIREKQPPDRALLLDLARCAAFAAEAGITLILNDRCDVALARAIPGVHLGQEDLPAQAARRICGPDAIIGLSTHSAAQVRAANRLDVDYVGFGPVFATATKDRHSPVVGIAGLARAWRRSVHPVVAIGGIGLRNLRAVLEAGAASAAVISAVMVPGRIGRSMEALLAEAKGKAGTSKTTGTPRARGLRRGETSARS